MKHSPVYLPHADDTKESRFSLRLLVILASNIHIYMLMTVWYELLLMFLLIPWTQLFPRSKCIRAFK